MKVQQHKVQPKEPIYFSRYFALYEDSVERWGTKTAYEKKFLERLHEVPGIYIWVAEKEGEVFLLPAKVPHSPMRSEGSIGLVIECKRTAKERDGLMWFCDKCNEPLHDTYFQLTNVEKDFQPRFKEFYSSEDKRTCNSCGHTMEIDKRFI